MQVRNWGLQDYIFMLHNMLCLNKENRKDRNCKNNVSILIETAVMTK